LVAFSGARDLAAGDRRQPRQPAEREISLGALASIALILALRTYMHIKYISRCRVCGSSALTPVIDLGPQYLQGAFIKAGRKPPPLRKIPTAVVRCDPTRDQNACGLVQMSCSVPPEILYSVYWYRSGTNRTMREHLRAIACEAAELLGKQTARVLDIGCNDGTLLRSYSADYEKFGIDPSDIVEAITDGITVVRDRFPSARLTTAVEGRRFEIITSIAMFYDLEDPIAFVREVKNHLAPDGLWIFEMAYLPSTLLLNSYDTICHEHLEYYSLAVLEHITSQAGMKIFRASLNDINGGSIRCYATHGDVFRYDQSSWLEELRQVRLNEFELGLEANAPYDSFRVRVSANIEKLTTVLKTLRQAGKRLHIYGASTKGNTILQACGLDRSTLECAADRNPEKHGAHIIGSEIPIVSEEESRSMNPDYYLVLPWHFKAEFLQREQETLKRGVGMIFPLPDVDIVTWSNLPSQK